jgi:hypothetical protein
MELLAPIASQPAFSTTIAEPPHYSTPQKQPGL